EEAGVLHRPHLHIGVGVAMEPGGIVWNELGTRDTDAAAKFFEGLLGGKADGMEMGPVKYTRFLAGEHMAGGMMALPPEMASVPPHWMVYFGTDDVDAAADRAQRSGGKITLAPHDIPGIGRFAILADPAGA